MIDETVVLTRRELIRWIRAWYALVITFVTPLFWIVLFGQSFNITKVFQAPFDLPPALKDTFTQFTQRVVQQVFGTPDYFTYLASGMLAVFILFTTMFNGMSIVWDRRFGFLTKLLAAPIPREAIFLSRVVSGVIRGLLQVTVIFFISLLFGLKFGNGFTVVHALGIFAALALLGLAFAALFTGVAAALRSQETLIAFANLVNLPLMFTSNALFPLSQMPDWLQTIARVNPITYAAEAVRGLVLVNVDLNTLLLYYGVLAAFATATLILGTIVSRKAFERL